MENKNRIQIYESVINKLKNKEKLNYKDLNSVPRKHGLYIIFDKHNKIIYVGITTTRKNGLNGRLKAHFSGNINSSVFDKAIDDFYNFNGNKEKIKNYIRINFKFIFKEIEKIRERKLIEDYIVSIANPDFNYYFIDKIKKH